jgi:uncharacterized protein with FMN-binding domain
LVLTGTACGLVAVIGYHTAVPQATASTGSSSGGGSRTLNIGGTGSSTGSSSSSSSTTGANGTAASTTATTSATTSASETTRSAVGSDVQYQYGDIELKVTMTGGNITDVAVVREDITDPHSQQIDEYAVPDLRSQALSAQSAKLDGVSGASFTSAAYEQSLQSALDKLNA